MRKLDDPSNGAQGFAVAPVRDGKVDTDQIVIAYRGTQSIFNEDDVRTDLEQIVEGKKQYTKSVSDKIISFDGSITTLPITKKVDSQFTTALKFADQIQKKYPDAKITTTGHSLGAGMAQAVAVEKKFHAVTFAAPNVYQLLSKKGKERVRNGETKSQIVDYTHHNDVVGTFSEFGDPQIGRQLFVKEVEPQGNFWSDAKKTLLSAADHAIPALNLLHIISNQVIGGHYLGTFANGFNKDGSAELLLDPDAVHQQTNRLRAAAEELKALKSSLVHYADHEEERIRRLKNKYIRETEAGGRFSLLDSGDVMDILREIAPYRSHGALAFHDPAAYTNLLTHLNSEQIKVDELAGRIDYAVKEIANRDRGAAATIKELIE
ncbi:MAG: hypothetical protein ACE3JK_07685 [Sporolactobacillus sp.]